MSARSTRCVFWMASPFRLFICNLLLVLACLTSQAQSVGNGSIEGRVEDAAGAVVSRAEVTITSLNLKAASDEQGNFRIAEVPAGKYTVRVSYIGFAPVSTEVEVRPGENAAITLRLKSWERQRTDSCRGFTATRRG